LEECPWLPVEGAGETERWGLLKKLLIGSTTVDRMFFLESLAICELSFAMLDDSKKQQALSYQAYRPSITAFAVFSPLTSTFLHSQLLMVKERVRCAVEP